MKQLDTLTGGIVFPALIILVGLLAIFRRYIYFRRGPGYVIGAPAVFIGLLLVTIGVGLYWKTLPELPETRMEPSLAFALVPNLICILSPLAALYALFSIRARLAWSSEKPSKNIQSATNGAVLVLCIICILIAALIWLG